eukprot:355051-Chlamydomonas_euryale.AAC.3
MKKPASDALGDRIGRKGGRPAMTIESTFVGSGWERGDGRRHGEGCRHENGWPHRTRCVHRNGCPHRNGCRHNLCIIAQSTHTDPTLIPYQIHTGPTVPPH